MNILNRKEKDKEWKEIRLTKADDKVRKMFLEAFIHKIHIPKDFEKNVSDFLLRYINQNTLFFYDEEKRRITGIVWSHKVKKTIIKKINERYNEYIINKKIKDLEKEYRREKETSKKEKNLNLCKLQSEMKFYKKTKRKVYLWPSEDLFEQVLKAVEVKVPWGWGVQVYENRSIIKKKIMIILLFWVSSTHSSSGFSENIPFLNKNLQNIEREIKKPNSLKLQETLFINNTRNDKKE